MPDKPAPGPDAGPSPAALEAAIAALGPSPGADALLDARWAIEGAIAGLQAGRLRVAEILPDPGRPVHVHAWLKRAILLYFRLLGQLGGPVAMGQGFDLVPQRSFGAADRVRAVPPAAVRVGAYIGPGAVLMPCFVNIGAHVGAGTMVDTWATVGSCAQVGAEVHLSGGVGLGGVLEPAGARPVVVEDGAFVGSRVVVVEGVRIGARAVLGAGLVLTASSPILDLSAPEAPPRYGSVPADSVVVPGTRPRALPGGTVGLMCALIVGRRHAGTDLKTSLEATLREHQISV